MAIPVSSRGNSSYSSGSSHAVDENQEDDITVSHVVNRNKEVDSSVTVIEPVDKNTSTPGNVAKKNIPHTVIKPVTVCDLFGNPCSAIPRAISQIGSDPMSRFLKAIRERDYTEADQVFKGITLTENPYSMDGPSSIENENELFTKNRKIVQAVIGYNDKESIQYIERKEFSFDFDDGTHAIHYALKEKKNLAFEALLDVESIDLSVTNNKGQTALHMIAERNNSYACSAYLTKCKEKKVLNDTINKTDKIGRVAVLIALEKQHVFIFQSIAQQDEADLSVVEPVSRKTILHIVAERNDISGFSMFMQQAKTRGVLQNIIDQKDRQDRTAVFIAAQKNHYQILERLVHSHANYKTTAKGVSPADAAPIIYCRSEARKILYNADKGLIIFEDGTTATSLSEESRPSTTQSAGPSVTEKRMFDELALNIFKGEFDQTLILIRNNEINLNNVDAKGNNSLLLVMKSKNLSEDQKLQLLLELREKGEMIDHKNFSSESALIIATKKKHMSIVKELLEVFGDDSKNIDVNYQDRLGNTALHYAAENGKEKIVKKLVNSGANVMIANKIGKTPTNLAKDPTIEEFLIDHSAKVLETLE